MTITSEEVLVRDSIKKFQLHQDKKAFNLLLEKYFISSCGYATKFLSNSSCSKLTKGYFDEVESYVFGAFLKAVNNYRLDDEKVSTFKNYLYQLIRFETLLEIKRYFNWQTLSKEGIKKHLEDGEMKEKTSFDISLELEKRDKVEEIGKFLKSKKKIYLTIGKLKMEEVESEEICRMTKMTIKDLRNRGSYIKRLVRERYSCEDLPL